ncbi:MAG: 6-bladed beta-propeller, partial [Bacteroidales bacterium]|nr:6-bladed beta-propeller [Bacteroidales bacterium]
MKLHHFYLVILIIGITVSCANPKETTNDVIKIDPDEFINPPDHGEDWIDSIKFIRLETLKDFFIPNDAKCKKRGEYWLIGNTDQLLIFDENGNSVGSLKSKGKGPTEFAYIGDFDLVPETEEIVLCE